MRENLNCNQTIYPYLLRSESFQLLMNPNQLSPYATTEENYIVHARPLNWLMTFFIVAIVTNNLLAQQLSLKIEVDQQLKLTLLHGIAGNNYIIESTTDLASPSSWEARKQLPLEGDFANWIDPRNKSDQTRFYRAKPATLQTYNPPPAPPTQSPRVFIPDDLLGFYDREPVQNDWHSGSISYASNSTTILQWTNDAGASWTLTPDLINQILATGATNPYQSLPNGMSFALDQAAQQLTGFGFNGETYSKRGVAQVISDRMNGYLSTFMVNSPPPTHAYGFSYYSAVWSMLDTPLQGFQVGLPGTWLLPNNNDFFEPLLPPDNPIRIALPDRGPYWRDVFQTVEGSPGSWVTTQFPSAIPKYRMNGSINGYINEVSSPGWGFGQTDPLPPEAMGLAQLSNRLLVPPDGLTFKGQPGGEFMGCSWIALPLIPSTSSVGDQSWTYFVNAANFKGAVAFYVPELWTRYSQVYPTVTRRGLDVRPGIVPPLAMEFGQVPMKKQISPSGTTYSRVPRLLFPTNGARVTYLTTDLTIYSKAALFTPVENWFAGGAPSSGKITHQGSFVPQLQANPIGFTSSDGTSMSGFSSFVQSSIVTTPGGGQAIALQWSQNSTPGVMPEYFHNSNGSYTAISASQLPLGMMLSDSGFREQSVGSSYFSPPSWNPPATTTEVSLSDGSRVRYAWYRFVDQPAVQSYAWSPAQKQLVQSRIEMIHTNWSSTANFMKAPTGGVLVDLDPALIVSPPPGMEAGYVPIVIRQWKP